MTINPIVKTLYVFELEDGTVQVKCDDLDNLDECRELMERGIEAVDDGTPVTQN